MPVHPEQREILVIEDEEPIRKILQQLEIPGVTLTMTSDPSESDQILQSRLTKGEKLPDGIFADALIASRDRLNLDSDTVTWAEKIAQEPGPLRNIPVAMTSATTDAPMVSKIHSLRNVVLFIAKPFELSAFEAAIKFLLAPKASPNANRGQ